MWRARNGLQNEIVLVTRPAAQAASLGALLADRGARVIYQPVIEIGPPNDWKPVDDALTRLDQFDWVVFSSSNGVEYFLRRLEESGRGLGVLGHVKLAAIGPATAAELAKYQLTADRVPAEFRAESLAESLRGEAARGLHFLLVRASRGRETLAERLAAAGGSVTQVVAYASADTLTPHPEIRQRLARGEIDWVTVTSSAIARSLAHMFGEALRASRLASISPVTSATLRQLGFEPQAEAETYTMQGVVDAICKVA